MLKVRADSVGICPELIQGVTFLKTAVFLIILLAVITAVQNNIPVVKKIKISNSGLKGIRIVQLSDLHKKSFGSLNSGLIKKLRQLSPSLIMMTGDMVSRQGTKLEPLETLLSASVRICPVYYVLGNHERDMDSRDFNELLEVFRRTSVTLLKNQSADITIYGKKINITGLCYERANFRNKKGGFRGLKPYLINDINEAVGLKPEGYTILLAHNPFYLDTYASWGADLVLSGHVHGGIVRLPFIGGLLSPERKLIPEYSAGIYSNDRTIMYVNRGLGKFRIFNPPEITLIEFE